MKKDRLDYSFISTITTCMSQMLSSNKYKSKRQNETTEDMSMCFFYLMEWKEKDTLSSDIGRRSRKFEKKISYCFDVTLSNSKPKREFFQILEL
jgi:hypothetical protein